jgi:hypothetical protein
MRVLVCGGRNYDDFDRVVQVLGVLKPTPGLLIHGGASGADSLAALWAHECGIPTLPFYAAWHVHGRAAGPMRNQRMLDVGKPDLVVAFPGGRGTADLLRRAEAAGVEVLRA